jgi:polyribonucleotide nucleotidyltransferase
MKLFSLKKDIDNRGRIKLTMKGVDQTIAPTEEAPAAE